MPSLAWGIPPSLTTRLHSSCRSMSSEIVSVTTRRCKYPAWLSALPHHSVSPHVSPSCSTPHPYTPAGTSDCATVLPLRSPHRPPASPCPQTDPRRAPCVLQATHNSSCPIPSVSLPTTSEKDSPPPPKLVWEWRSHGLWELCSPTKTWELVHTSLAQHWGT